MVYDCLWKPLAPDLDKVQRVFISPDGKLGYCPFAALPAGKDQYLIEKVELTLQPCPGMMTETFSPGKLAASNLLEVNNVDTGDVADKRQFPVWSAVYEEESYNQHELLKDVFRQRFPNGMIDHLADARSPMVGANVMPWQAGAKAPTTANFRDLAPGHEYLDLFLHGFYEKKPKGIVSRDAPELEASKVPFWSGA